MALKLKLKVPSSNDNGSNGGGSSSARTPSTGAPNNNSSSGASSPSLPKLKLSMKAPKSNKSGGGIVKKEPLVEKERHKKLKISLGGKHSHSQEKAKPTTAAPASSSSSSTSKLGKVTNIRVKPTRIPGEGYDAEAPDLEDDPLVEEGIVIRFLNDINLEAVQSAVDTGNLSNIFIKWLTKEKAVVHVNQTLYSARLIDLPTLTELYKTVDKKNIYKTIDICQILLVLHPINPEDFNIERDFEIVSDETYVHPLYKMSPNQEIKPTRIIHKDGLSYPYEGVHRRFRPRKVSHRVMDDIDTRVAELIKRDNKSDETHYELVDLNKVNRYRTGTSSTASSSVSTPLPNNESTTIKREGGEGQQEEGQQLQNDVDLLENALQQELEALEDDESDEEDATKAHENEEENEDEDEDMNELFEGTGEQPEQQEEEDDEEDEEEEEEDEDDDEDENVKQEKSKAKKLEEDIVDLEQVLKSQKEKYGNNPNKMIQMKYQSNMGTLRGQLEIKKRELAKIRDEQQKLQEKLAPNHAIDPNQREEQEEDNNNEDDDDDEGEDLDGLF